jgi:hypothetical protein
MLKINALYLRWGFICLIFIFFKTDIKAQSKFKKPKLFSALFSEHEEVKQQGVVWKSISPVVSIQELAAYCAPILWFSPDEPSLNKDFASHGVQIPEAFPFDFQNNNTPVVYYKIPDIFTGLKNTIEPFNENPTKGLSLINVTGIKVLYIEYYFYYEHEQGLGSHHHDIESVIMKLIVDNEANDGFYKIRIENVIGRAHGLYWYNNVHVVNRFTKFPISVFVEEGKHASCPDADGDGIYSPGWDVNIRINDAWGVRDIIRSGYLFTGGYQSWMARPRKPSTIVVPPLPSDSPYFTDFSNDARELTDKKEYRLLPYPELTYKTDDKHLRKLIDSKKPQHWPHIHKTIWQEKDIHVKEDGDKKPITVAYRWDSGRGVALYTPLLLFKNVSVPMTGGWFINKFYSERVDLFKGEEDATVFGHMIMHTSSASRWLDTFVGLGYEINDYNSLRKASNYRTEFAGEFGIKIRGSLKTKFGSHFLGIRLGLKTTGFNPSKLGTLVEFGAGVW